MNKVVCVYLTDLITGKKIVRELDISVLYRNGSVCWELETDYTRQIELIEKWIEERGDKQHNTYLECTHLEIREIK